MIHHLSLAADACLRDDPTSVVLDLGTTSPGDVALALSLLAEGLVERLRLRDVSARSMGQLVRSTNPRDVRLRHPSGQVLELTLGQVELERWRTFFLKYHRDGFAEVDHLDLEALGEDGSWRDVTLKVAAFSPRTTGHEARRSKRPR